MEALESVYIDEVAELFSMDIKDLESNVALIQ